MEGRVSLTAKDHQALLRPFRDGITAITTARTKLLAPQYLAGTADTPGLEGQPKTPR